MASGSGSPESGTGSGTGGVGEGGPRGTAGGRARPRAGPVNVVAIDVCSF